jgi:DNA processing protein
VTTSPDRAGSPAGIATGAGRAVDLETSDRLARAWLSRVVEPGNLLLHLHVTEFGAAETVRRIRAGTAPPLLLRAAAARRDHDGARRDLEAADILGIRFVTPADAEWPIAAIQTLERASPADSDAEDGSYAEPDDTDRRTAHRDDVTGCLVPPLGLWLRGPQRLDEIVARSVAVVGSRAATAYGEHVAGEIGYGLTDRGWPVLSGGAYGIDAAAHRGALGAGGPTVAVLACGLDRLYPRSNALLLQEIAETGLLMSEYAVGAAPLRHRFLIRNRLIAALSVGTVVVEASARSGAQATAHRAARLGRAVMAVPGPVTSAMSVGAHDLIRSGGARLVTSAAEVLEEVAPIGAHLSAAPRGPVHPRDELDEVGRLVLDAVPVRREAALERIAQVAGVPAGETLRALALLAASGLVETKSGGWRLAP